jgi:cytochrome b6-f complex iron-sulfur subunit
LLIYYSLSLLVLTFNIGSMNRKEFFARVGFGAAAVLVPACIAGVATSCSNDNSSGGNPAPTGVDFSVDVSTGTLATNGGFMVTQGIVIARTLTGSFLAVSASCTHEGTNVNYSASGNKFVCPNHGAQFSSTGVVTVGPATRNLTVYNTTLNGNSLRVFS